MTYRIFIPLIIILCSSCKENKNEKIAHLIAEWEGREIIFPKNNLFTTPNGDTIYNIPESDYKIVTFIDSLGCTICKLQLTKWKKFISEIDTLCKYKTPILFFLQTNSPNKIKDILTKEDFLYPVCVDLQDGLNLLNHFPKDLMFQTFLLDKNNKIKLIGNPIHNFAIKELYIREICNIRPQKPPLTKIESDTLLYNMGVVKKGESKKHFILLKNIGSKPFSIKEVLTSCDCLNVTYNWNKINPGKSDTIKVLYHGEDEGDFWRTITIYGNIPEQSLTLDLIGECVN